MSRSPFAGEFCWAGSLALGVLLELCGPTMAWAQEQAPQPAAATEEVQTDPQVPDPEVPGTEKPADTANPTSHRDFVGFAVGLVNVATDQALEVDKDGPVFSVRASRSWELPSLFNASVGLGLLTSAVKGSGAYTTGDQEAKLTTPWLEGAVGYQPLSWLAFQAGLQVWLAKGSNFAPEEDEKGNQPFLLLRLRYAHEAIKPFVFTLEHLRGTSTDDRMTSSSLVGLDFPI